MTATAFRNVVRKRVFGVVHFRTGARGVLPWLLLCGSLAQQPPSGVPGAAGETPPRRWASDPEKVHDPSTILTVNGVSRCFSTGFGVTLLREDAAGKWLPEGRLFADGKLPAWHSGLVPGNRGHLWAPDLIRIGDRFFVYYSVSTFGKNTSAIGLVVGKTLDPAASNWGWEDRGPVIVSRSGDRFNAIDPALFHDRASGSLWMAFGSFWDGIHLVELDPATGLQRDARRVPERIAWAPEIEAPFLHQREGYSYLFLNWGQCCRGVESTYEIRVGRSRAATGPYVDRDGTDLRNGGGTLVLAGEERWIGPGHASLFERDGKEWLAHHYYDRELNGRSRLAVQHCRDAPTDEIPYAHPFQRRDKQFDQVRLGHKGTLFAFPPGLEVRTNPDAARGGRPPCGVVRSSRAGAPFASAARASCAAATRVAPGVPVRRRARRQCGLRCLSRQAPSPGPGSPCGGRTWGGEIVLRNDAAT